MSYQSKVLSVTKGGTGLASTTANQLLYSSATSTIAGLASAANGVLVTDGSSVPSIGSTLPTAVQGNITSTGNLGNQLNTTRCAFFAYLSGNVSNVTGDGTDYSVVWDTESFDQGNNFNSTTGVFTAPVTGKYLFSTSIFTFPTNNVAFTSSSVTLVASGHTYILMIINPNNACETLSNNSFMLGGTIIVPMTANDTCVARINVSGGAKTVGVGGSLGLSYFSGYLVC